MANSNDAGISSYDMAAEFVGPFEDMLNLTREARELGLSATLRTKPDDHCRVLVYAEAEAGDGNALTPRKVLEGLSTLSANHAP